MAEEEDFQSVGSILHENRHTFILRWGRIMDSRVVQDDDSQYNSGGSQKNPMEMFPDVQGLFS